jgi:hypothetical protein
MHRFEAILSFYKPLFIWSFMANLGITFFNPTIFHALIAKLFLTIFLWYYISETSAKDKLSFCNNLGISSFKLFATVFIIDSILMIFYLLLIKEFI